MRAVLVEDELFEQANDWATRSGCASLEQFVASAIQQGILQAKREAFRKSSGEMRKRCEELGISEEEVLADFDRFRTELYATESFVANERGATR